MISRKNQQNKTSISDLMIILKRVHVQSLLHIFTRRYRRDLRTRFVDTVGLGMFWLSRSLVWLRLWIRQIVRQMEDFILQHTPEQLTTLIFSASRKLSKKKTCWSLRLFSNWLVSELCWWHASAPSKIWKHPLVHNVEHGRKCEACWNIQR